MHHHMRTLRAAGLVRITIGPERRYELRPETIATTQQALDVYLQGASSGTTADNAVRRVRPVRRVRRQERP
jgi:hypothetical protein